MINLHLKDAVRGVGRSQGYEGISVLHRIEPVRTDEGEVMARTTTTAWEFTPTELEELARGAPLLLTLVAAPTPPMLLRVGSAPDEPGAELESEAGVPMRGATAMRRGYDVSANPHPKNHPDALDWIADWHRENARCYRDFVESDGARLPEDR